MKKLYLLMALFIFQFGNAQVGIGTTNPQQELHIAGNNSTIRIDGLNSGNNALNDGVNNSPILVNANGDLILGPSAPSELVDRQGGALINPSVRISHSTGDWTTATLASGNFNIINTRWVSGNYEIAVTDIFKSTGSIIKDGAPRLVSIFVYIDGNQVSRDSTIFTNSSTLGGVTIVNGVLILKGSFFEKLTTGNHTYTIEGGIYGGTFSTRADFGGSAVIDRLQIIGF